MDTEHRLGAFRLTGDYGWSLPATLVIGCSAAAGYVIFLCVAMQSSSPSDESMTNIAYLFALAFGPLVGAFHSACAIPPL
jgi:hypothetical protein